MPLKWHQLTAQLQKAVQFKHILEIKGMGLHLVEPTNIFPQSLCYFGLYEVYNSLTQLHPVTMSGASHPTVF